MLRLIASCVSVAKRAGTEVRRITKSGVLDVVDKGVQDFQTEADRTAQRMIVATLTQRFKKCIIVGEEDLEKDDAADKNLIVDSEEDDVLKVDLPAIYKNVKEEDITIWVDPLDGTTEFVKGLLEHVTILIGISINGRSVAGIIHQPFYGHSTGSLAPRTMWGLVGLGCYGISKLPLDTNKLVITTTASHGNKNIEDSIAAIKPDEVLKVGGAGHKVLLVIEGKAHSYVFTSNGCKKWDTCAPEAVLRATGGQLTDSFGNEIEYNYREDGNYQNSLGIIASTNDTIQSKVVGSVPSQVKERLLELHGNSISKSKI